MHINHAIFIGLSNFNQELDITHDPYPYLHSIEYRIDKFRRNMFICGKNISLIGMIM